MKYKEGFVYHIKNEYFDIVKDNTLMKNHEDGRTRPTYFCIKDKETKILWFIPMSSKVEKYKKIRDLKIKKYGNCDTILIKKFLGKNTVFLLQNMFPTIEKYVDHVHIVNGKEARVIETITKQIEEKFNKLINLSKKGRKVVFTNIEKDISIMLRELNKE